jgi:hypothetical protein
MKDLNEAQKERIVVMLDKGIERDIEDTINDCGIYDFIQDAMLLKDYMLNMVTLKDIMSDMDNPPADNERLRVLHENYVDALSKDLKENLDNYDKSWQYESIAVLYLLGEKELAEEWAEKYGYSKEDYMETVTDIESMTYGSSLEKVSDLVKQYDSLQIGLDVSKEQDGEER